MAESSSPFTLLVAVDYSDPSIVAVDEALRQATLHPHARVLALLVLPGEAPAGADLAPAAQSYIEKAQQNLVDLLETRQKQIGKRLAAGSFQGRVTFGEPAPAIVREAKALGAGLIVLGTHGRRAFERIFLGSVAIEVAQRAHCSVVIARAESIETRNAESEHFEAPEQPPVVDASAGHSPGQIVSEAHIDAQRVVVHVLDEASGRVFVAAFQGFGKVTIEPMEGEWSIPPSADERARAAEIALGYSREEQSLFEELFEELTRRNQR
jgi:nucleotide-binding universal stress UspA family protein